MASAVGKIAAPVKRANKSTNFGMCDGISLLGVCIRPGASASLNIELVGGATELFLGAGDEDARVCVCTPPDRFRFIAVLLRLQICPPASRIPVEVRRKSRLSLL